MPSYGYYERSGPQNMLKIINTVTFIVMVIVNALANILPLNGLTTGDVSDAYPNLFAPAPITFSIWGVIYSGLALFILFQQKKRYDGIIQYIGNAFWISSVANILWIFAWHYNWIGTSLVLMIVILICLIHINVKLRARTLSLTENICVRAPFSIYFGWITVATIANVTTFLVYIGWNGFGIADEWWTIFAIVAGIIIATLTAWRQQDILYSLVIIWAYTGILLKHTSVNGFHNNYPAIISTVISCIVIMCVVIALIFFKQRTNRV